MYKHVCVTGINDVGYAHSRAELLNVFIGTSQNVGLWVIPLAKVSIDVDFMKGCIKGSNMAGPTP